MKGLIVAILIFVVVVGIPLLMYVSYNNQEVVLRNQCKAQQKANEAVFDRVWLVLRQQAGVTEEYKGAFRQIYSQVMDARYKDNKGLLAKFVREANPEFDSSLFGKLFASIEAQQTDFTREQKKLVDIKQAHDNLRMKIPGSFFVGSRPELEIIIVTTSETAEAFRTGRHDNISLFEKPAQAEAPGGKP